MDLGGQVTKSSTLPTFRGRELDLSGVAQGDALTIGETAYLVAEVRPDGTGFIELGLHFLSV